MFVWYCLILLHSFYWNEWGEWMIAYHGGTGLHEHLRCDGIRRVHFRANGTPYLQMSVLRLSDPAPTGRAYRGCCTALGRGTQPGPAGPFFGENCPLDNFPGPQNPISGTPSPLPLVNAFPFGEGVRRSLTDEVHPVPAGPFSLKTGHWPVFRALTAPHRACRCCGFKMEGLPPLQTSLELLISWHSLLHNCF